MCIRDSSNANRVEVNFYSDKSTVKLKVSDNGKVDVNNIKTSGTGLTNIKLRTENVKGRYNFNYDKGFLVEISIPLN